MVKIILSLIVLTVIVVLTVDYIKTYYFTKRNKAVDNESRKPENVDDSIVDDSGMTGVAVEGIDCEETHEPENYEKNKISGAGQIFNADDNLYPNQELPITNIEKITEPKTIEFLIKSAYDLHLNTAVVFLAINIVLLSCFTLSGDGGFAPGLIGCFLLLFTFGQFKNLVYFINSFKKTENHVLYWTYPNGDKMLLTRWGLINYHTTLPKLSTSVKFEGFKWELENAKDLAEAVLANEGSPLMALIPSIRISTSTNRVDEYIDFSFSDTVKIVFLEKDRGWLIIYIKQKNKQFKLSYPLPPQKESLQQESEIFEQKVQGHKSPVRGLYIEKSTLDKILNG